VPATDAGGVAVETEGAPRSRHTCLLVDDHLDMLATLTELLEHEGFVIVGQAATGVSAVDLLDAQRPDLAVLDYRLPDMTGIDLAREAARVSPLTVVVLHAGEASQGLVTHALEAGVRGVVLKGVPPTHLMLSLEAALAGQTYVDPKLGGFPLPTTASGSNLVT
jgi:DNA-binding NarL/FixJ family response regulator